MRVGLGIGVARVGVDETITGLWTFANVLGLLTDIIGERTAAAGVTVDGLLIRDAGIPEAAVTAHEAALAILESQITPGTLLARVASPETVTGDWTFTERIAGGDGIAFDTLALATTFAFLARVTGATFAEFALQANGDMSWGDGTGPRDTNLFRPAANELATDDDFNVGGALDLAADIELSEGTITFNGDATVHDIATGTETIVRIDPNGTSNVSGFGGGRAGRILILLNVTSAGVGVLSDNVGSVAANRVLGPGNANFTLDSRDGVMLVYDTTVSRWKTVSLSV